MTKVLEVNTNNKLWKICNDALTFLKFWQGFTLVSQDKVGRRGVGRKTYFLLPTQEMGVRFKMVGPICSFILLEMGNTYHQV
jgi:hypothetical protein